MKKNQKNIGLVAAAALIVAGPTWAADGEALAKANNCLGCHTVDKKLVGPAYKDIAAKYRGRQDAEGALVQKVKAGGTGVWGPVPMPPNAAAKEDDVRTIVKWVLSL
jgi:cytochrome c